MRKLFILDNPKPPKTMKKTLLLVLAIAAFCMAGCCEKQTQTTEVATPKIESTGELPILAWHSIPADSTTLERFLEMKDIGINTHFSGYPDADAMERALDLAEQAGIKIIISCPELSEEPEKTVIRFMNHPALAGYFLRDEPNTSAFPELAAWAKRIRATDDNHFCYLNLLPTYAPLDMLQAESYRDYVHRFDQEVPLQLLSFDHYPIVGDHYRPDWYENLEIFSDEARKAGKPFWAFALATAHDPYPIPDLSHLRLQMYSNLAYGAQGLQYFTYWTPGKNPNWNFHHGPIGLDGKRTDVYDKIKTLNTELQALSGVFLGAEVISVRHTGDSSRDRRPDRTARTGQSSGNRGRRCGRFSVAKQREAIFGNRQPRFQKPHATAHRTGSRSETDHEGRLDRRRIALFRYDDGRSGRCDDLYVELIPTKPI